jgi:hypothetical protein
MNTSQRLLQNLQLALPLPTHITLITLAFLAGARVEEVAGVSFDVRIHDGDLAR